MAAEESYPEDLKYHAEHDWAGSRATSPRSGSPGTRRTRSARSSSSSRPRWASTVSKDEAYAEVESVKAVSDVYAPLSGEVVEVNEARRRHPGVINNDPYGDGWLAKVKLSDRDPRSSDPWTPTTRTARRLARARSRHSRSRELPVAELRVDRLAHRRCLEPARRAPRSNAALVAATVIAAPAPRPRRPPWSRPADEPTPSSTVVIAVPRLAVDFADEGGARRMQECRGREMVEGVLEADRRVGDRADAPDEEGVGLVGDGADASPGD